MKNILRQRFYPEPELVDLLARTFGCVRVVANDAIVEIRKAVDAKAKLQSYKEMSASLTATKRR